MRHRASHLHVSLTSPTSHTCGVLGAIRVWQLPGAAAVSGPGGQAAVHGRGIGHKAAARCPQGTLPSAIPLLQGFAPVTHSGCALWAAQPFRMHPSSSAR
jgi:hypothetical protein